MAQSVSACGTQGSVCKACLPGQLCSAGSCVKDPNAVVVIDDGGAQNVDAGMPDSGQPTCGARGLACCASGSACYFALTCQSGVCLPPATDAGVCGGLGQACCSGSCTASGTVCQSNVCVAQSTPDAGTDAGNQLKMTGEACTADAQCVDGTCLQVGFDSGYCTKACTTSVDCFAGSQCGVNPSGIGPAKVCLKQCSNPGVAPGGCRSGYVCEANAGTSGVPVCFPACTSVTQCGLAPDCDSRGFCCGGDGFVCCNGNTCLNGTSCQSGTCRAGGGTGGGSGSTGGGSGAGGGTGTSGGGTGTSGGGTGTSGGGTGTSGGGTGTSGGGTGTSGGGTGTSSANGDPCTDVSQCPGNRCIVQSGNQWQGGYCSETCSGSGGCRSGSSCTSFGLFAGSNDKYCLDDCAWTGGQSSCRSGYVCDRNFTDRPGTSSCVPACTSPAQCGTGLGCESGFCCGLQTYRCCAGNTCQGGSCVDGYCQ